MMGQMKMSNSDFKDKAQGTVSLFKSAFNYLDDREDDSARKGNYRRSITEIKEDSQDEVKADAAPKPAENKGKASSYKEEVTKLYANFGNPSGGFVHNALAGKKRSR